VGTSILAFFKPFEQSGRKAERPVRQELRGPLLLTEVRELKGQTGRAVGSCASVMRRRAFMLLASGRKCPMYGAVASGVMSCSVWSKTVPIGLKWGLGNVVT